MAISRADTHVAAYDVNWQAQADLPRRGGQHDVLQIGQQDLRDHAEQVIHLIAPNDALGGL